MGYQWSNISYQESSGRKRRAYLRSGPFLCLLILAAHSRSRTLPLASFGHSLALEHFSTAGAIYSATYVNNVFAQIGLVAGVCCYERDLIITEFAKMNKDAGEVKLIMAALDGAKLRFRPILMTSLAFISGVTPLLTAHGAGAEARKVMGIAVFSGMLVATIIGVILTPPFCDDRGQLTKKEGSMKPINLRQGVYSW